MVTSLVLLVLAPAAPVPKPPAPPVEVTFKPYVFPPEITVGGNGVPMFFSVDDGYFIEVTVKNTSKEVVAVPYTKRLREPVHDREGRGDFRPEAAPRLPARRRGAQAPRPQTRRFVLRGGSPRRQLGRR